MSRIANIFKDSDDECDGSGEPDKGDCDADKKPVDKTAQLLKKLDQFDLPENKSPLDLQSAKVTGFNFVHKNFKPSNVSEFKVPMKKSSNVSADKDALP